MRCEDCPHIYHDNCDDRCPAVPSRKIKYYCALCGDPIYEGDGAFHFRGDSYCEGCYMNDITAAKLAELYNERGFDYD